MTVELAALRFLWSLEERGLVVRGDGPNLLVGPGRALTNADRAAVREHKQALLALLAYGERGARA